MPNGPGHREEGNGIQSGALRRSAEMRVADLLDCRAPARLAWRFIRPGDHGAAAGGGESSPVLPMRFFFLFEQRAAGWTAARGGS